MKNSRILAAVAGALLLCSCEEVVVEHRPVVVHRRYIAYTATEPYYRVYYREPGGRSYYRRVYYEDEAGYPVRIDTRHYYYTSPVDRTYGF